jgi:hypothetical protein
LFGHCKVALQDPVHEFDMLLCTLSYQHGFSPKLWHDIVNIEILKQAAGV